MCNIGSFQKPDEVKESEPDGEQKGDGGLFKQVVIK